MLAGVFLKLKVFDFFFMFLSLYNYYNNFIQNNIYIALDHKNNKIRLNQPEGLKMLSAASKRIIADFLVMFY